MFYFNSVSSECSVPVVFAVSPSISVRSRFAFRSVKNEISLPTHSHNTHIQVCFVLYVDVISAFARQHTVVTSSLSSSRCAQFCKFSYEALTSSLSLSAVPRTSSLVCILLQHLDDACPHFLSYSSFLARVSPWPRSFVKRLPRQLNRKTFLSLPDNQCIETFIKGERGRKNILVYGITSNISKNTLQFLMLKFWASNIPNSLLT